MTGDNYHQALPLCLSRSGLGSWLDGFESTSQRWYIAYSASIVFVCNCRSVQLNSLMRDQRVKIFKRKRFKKCSCDLVSAFQSRETLKQQQQQQLYSYVVQFTVITVDRLLFVANMVLQYVFAVLVIIIVNDLENVHKQPWSGCCCCCCCLQ